MDVNAAQLEIILKKYVSLITARSLLRNAVEKCRANPAPSRAAHNQQLFGHLQMGLRLFIRDADRKASCEAEIRKALNLGLVSVSNGNGPNPARATPRASSAERWVGSLLEGQSRPAARRSPTPAFAAGGLETARMVQVNNETDIVIARSHGMDACREMGFPMSVQIKFATAISELARNIVLYAGAGSIEFTEVEVAGRRGIQATARDTGPGIPNLDQIMSGRYRSRTGMGLGLVGTKRLSDEFSIESTPDKGTTVVIRKYL